MGGSQVPGLGRLIGRTRILVRKLERDLEKAIVEIVIHRNKNWKYLLMPSQHTMQMMAKAAAAVYEVAAAKQEQSE